MRPASVATCFGTLLGRNAGLRHLGNALTSFMAKLSLRAVPGQYQSLGVESGEQAQGPVRSDLAFSAKVEFLKQPKFLKEPVR